ncbi:hypothetical protein LENED_011394 [Lentinula edodes]|uniref:Uncharacterized protein n=1 Tax=Lentinula edodes TaxID=5353 RepID=A0A1Q3EPW6_LENED|nr:hypothetical protein LENED_011394 [Lentinula edodes]
MCQSALIHSASPAASAGTLALVLQLYFSVHSALSRDGIRFQRLWLRLAFALPYVVTLTLMTSVLVMSNAPGTVFIVSQYCSVNQLIPGRLAAGFTVVLIIPILFLNALIYVRLRKHWSEFRSSRLRNATSMIIRATMFSICGVFAFFVGIIFFTIIFPKRPGETEEDEVARLSKEYEVLNVILGLFPVFVVVIFGTQRDILRRLLFWQDQTSSSRTQEYPIPEISLELSISHPGQGEGDPGLDSALHSSTRIDYSEAHTATGLVDDFQTKYNDYQSPSENTSFTVQLSLSRIKSTFPSVLERLHHRSFRHDLLPPGNFSFMGGLNTRHIMFQHGFDAGYNPIPFSLLPGTNRGRTLRTIHEEQVWESSRCEPQICVHSILPLFLDTRAVDATDINLGYSSRDAIVTCCKNKSI